MSVLIDAAQVTAAKPAVFGERIGGRLRILIITGKDHRPFDKHLTDALGLRVGDLDLGAVHRLADRADAIVVLVSCRSGPARFRQAVALQNSESELVKILGDLFVKARTGRDRDTQPAAERFVHGTEQFVPEVYLQRVAKLAVDRQH